MARHTALKVPHGASLVPVRWDGCVRTSALEMATGDITEDSRMLRSRPLRFLQRSMGQSGTRVTSSRLIPSVCCNTPSWCSAGSFQEVDGRPDRFGHRLPCHKHAAVRFQTPGRYLVALDSCSVGGQRQEQAEACECSARSCDV